MASQGGSVEWFRFWLQDYEDPDHAKAHNNRKPNQSGRDDDMLRFSAMSAIRLDSVHSISIDPDVIATTLRVLQHFGAHECEGLVLWIGEIAHSHARITRAVVPD